MITNSTPVPEVIQDLLKHEQDVRFRIGIIVNALNLRGGKHDRSKFSDEEFTIFAKFMPKLKTTLYGSSAYKEYLQQMQPALKHHYWENRHHPEHFERGIREMNLVDIVEMFCDWYAAVARQKDGDIRRSIEVNQKRFNFSNDLEQIFLNTVEFFEGVE